MSTFTVFTVTTWVPSVKVKKSKLTMIRQSMCFYSGVDIVHFELNIIQLRIMLYSEL